MRVAGPARPSPGTGGLPSTPSLPMLFHPETRIVSRAQRICCASWARLNEDRLKLVVVLALAMVVILVRLEAQRRYSPRGDMAAPTGFAVVLERVGHADKLVPLPLPSHALDIALLS